VNYELVRADASEPPGDCGKVGLIWTHPPVMPWEYVAHKLSYWAPLMDDYGTMIVCRKDFTDVDELESIVREDILTHTQEGDLVVDPFCGSSTTGIAALSLGRRYLGVDISPRAIRASERRLYVNA
jgi:DNA methylase